MANKSIIVIFVIVFVGISLIITIPILTLSNGLSNYGTIDELLTFEYAPDSSSPVEKLNLNVDLGDVEIKYVTTPVDYYAKIQVNIGMFGHLIAGKDYKDFFEVDWDDSSPSPTFIMGFKSNVDKLEVLSLIKNITIIVYLRADIVFDIEATVIEGNIDFNVPFGVVINNVKLNNTKGNIFYDFQYCTLQGNITGIANDGNIGLMAYNPVYTRNTVWTFKSNAGGISIDISHTNQNKIMNATIIGSLVGNEFGDIIVKYFDNTANIGARITLNDTTQALINLGSDWDDGFELEVLKDLDAIPFGYELTSTDFPAITNYNLLLVGLTLQHHDGIYISKYEVHLSSS